MATQYKSQGKRSLFDEEFSIEKLSAIGNPLETISQVIDFEMFRSTLESGSYYIDNFDCNSLDQFRSAVTNNNPPYAVASKINSYSNDVSYNSYNEVAIKQNNTFEKESKLKIYPNPATNEFKIEY